MHYDWLWPNADAQLKRVAIEPLGLCNARS